MKRTIVVLIALIVSAPGWGQEQDRANYALEKANALALALDSTTTDADRVAAVKNVGFATPEINVQLLALAQDKGESDALRIAALKKHRYEPEWLDYLLLAIVDSTESDEFSAALVREVSQRTTFRQPADLRQRVQGALRQALADPRAQTRQIAFHTLIAAHDQMAINQLVEGLRGNIPLAMPAADAIHMLHTDGPVKHVATVRPYLTDPDPAVRAEAVRILAVDPQSREAISAMVADATVDDRIRINAMRALVREDEGIMARLIAVFSDDSETPDVRYAAVENGMRRMNYQNVGFEDQIAFAEAVRELMRASGQVTSKGKDLGVEAKLLFAHLRRNFPYIAWHFRRVG